MHEALYVSEQEEQMLSNSMNNIAAELQSPEDSFSQDILVAEIELFLKYCNRFYERQFERRSLAKSEVLVHLERILIDYWNEGKGSINGLPTVEFIANEIGVSVDYLSDLLRTTTGLSTQQHLHLSIIDKAKDLLANTNLTVKEVAYQLGFEYPQSFNKLFKKKTMASPLAYRKSFR